MKLKLLVMVALSLCFSAPAYCGVYIPGAKTEQPHSTTTQPRYKMKYGIPEEQTATDEQVPDEPEKTQVATGGTNGYLIERSSQEIPLSYNCMQEENHVKYCVDANRKPLEGKVALKGADGNYISIDNYKKGHLTGLSSLFYPNGNPKVRLYYKEGRKNGMYKSYYPGRNIEVSANYKDGKLDGMLDLYLVDGTLAGRMRYQNGKLEKGFCNTNGKKENLKPAMLKSLPENQIYTCGLPIWQPD